MKPPSPHLYTLTTPMGATVRVYGHSGTWRHTAAGLLASAQLTCRPVSRTRRAGTTGAVQPGALAKLTQK